MAQARFRERQKAKQADTERRMAVLEAELNRLQVLHFLDPDPDLMFHGPCVKLYQSPELGFDVPAPTSGIPRPRMPLVHVLESEVALAAIMR